ncbi:hypothetical protein [Nocardia yunnanensis]|uniref:hypothetical protein n=1 Tax=Nocardia yunnanensis TaxID=2382165 RepID=UPI0013C4D871|nr:hypothetical protein [Nocardia yunnanensis]
MDPDLLAAAAAASPNLAATAADPEAVAGWISGLDSAEKDGLLLRVAFGESIVVQAELLRRVRGATPVEPEVVGARTVADLFDGAARHRAERERVKAAVRKRELARQEVERARERERRLRGLARVGEQAWDRVEALAETGRAASYDEAAELLADLRDLAVRDGRVDEFDCRVAGLHERHARRPALRRRLADPSITGRDC